MSAMGALQIYCEDMQPDGIGALSLAFEQLKSKLEKEGLFDIEHKKTLPRFPQKNCGNYRKNRCGITGYSEYTGAPVSSCRSRIVIFLSAGRPGTRLYCFLLSASKRAVGY